MFRMFRWQRGVLFGLLCLVSLGDCGYYRYRLDIGNPNNLCPVNNSICSDGKLNFLCNGNTVISSRCSAYKPLIMTNLITKRFIEAHNGIRNKVAEDFRIANMNILHWSRELHLMATDFLRECIIGMDKCLLIGERELPVGQTMLFRKRLGYRWTGRCIRQWYLEIGANINTFKDFSEKRLRTHTMGNFSRITWPLTEFVGCSAAKMFNGNLIVCFYHPTYEGDDYERLVVLGRPCSRCNPDRPTCSQIFIGLCGLDVIMSAGNIVCASWLIVGLLLWLNIIRIAFDLEDLKRRVDRLNASLSRVAGATYLD